MDKTEVMMEKLGTVFKHVKIGSEDNPSSRMVRVCTSQNESEKCQKKLRKRLQVPPAK